MLELESESESNYSQHNRNRNWNRMCRNRPISDMYSQVINNQSLIKSYVTRDFDKPQFGPILPGINLLSTKTTY